MANGVLDQSQSIELKLTIACALLMLIIFAIDLQVPLGVAGSVPYIAVVLVSLWSPRSNLVIYFAIACSVFTLLGFYFSPDGGELWKVVSNRLLALLAIWITAFLGVKWKRHEHEILSLNHKMEIEREKEKIYLATIHGAQHITNNLLNQLQLVELEIENHPEFDKEVSALFAAMLAESKSLIDDLSSVQKIDDKTIIDSIYPK